MHKAAIMRASDGLFLDACREVSKDFPDIKFDDISLDNACLHVRLPSVSFCGCDQVLTVRV